LKTAITSIEKLADASDQILITVTDSDDVIVGYLKYGTKNLFFYVIYFKSFVILIHVHSSNKLLLFDLLQLKNGTVKECMSLCLLDFYVKEDVQRSGIGTLQVVL
jgi:GNAT acetyltransferase, Mec-17